MNIIKEYKINRSINRCSDDRDFAIFKTSRNAKRRQKENSTLEICHSNGTIDFFAIERHSNVKWWQMESVEKERMKNRYLLVLFFSSFFLFFFWLNVDPVKVQETHERPRRRKSSYPSLTLYIVIVPLCINPYVTSTWQRFLVVLEKTWKKNAGKWHNRRIFIHSCLLFWFIILNVTKSRILPYVNFHFSNASIFEYLCYQNRMSAAISRHSILTM